MNKKREQPVNEISWTASEYRNHGRGAVWYGVLGAVAAVTALGSYYLTDGDLFAPITITLALLAFGIFAARTPDQHEFIVDEQGISMGDSFHPYQNFSSFSLTDAFGQESINLIPTKRMSPPLTLDLPKDKADQILEMVGSYVPYAEKEASMVDKAMHRLRF